MLKYFSALLLISVSFFAQGWSTSSDSPYAVVVRQDSPIVYMRFEETEDNDSVAVETPNGIKQGQFTRAAGYIFKGYLSAYSSLGKSTYFRRDPRAYAAIAATDALSMGLDFATSAEFAIEAWIMPSQIGPYSQSIVSLDPAYGSKGYIFSLEANGSLTFHRLASAGVATNANTIKSGVWSHVAVVIKQLNKQSTAMIYVNGQPALTQWATIDAMAPGAGSPFLVGSRNIIAGDYSFVGCIDEVAVYNKALAQANLLNHYNTAVSSPPYPLQIGHSQQLMMNYGLQTGAWVLHGAGINPALWNGINLSTPVVNAQNITSGVLESIGKTGWGYVSPIGTLASDKGLLALPQSDLSHLISIQYGDEQDVTSAATQQQIASYYQEVHKMFPNVLVHTNQSGLQLNESQLRSLVMHTQPDLITFDTYYFAAGNQYPGGSLTGLYNRLAKYRKIANRGLDDTSTTPIPFGHFSQGYLQSGGQMSESEIRALLFAPWTMGAKWVCMFWYNFLDANGPSYLFGQFPDGSPLIGYQNYAKALQETKNLARSLVLLQTTQVYFILGSYLANNATLKNALPSPGIYEWNGGVDPYLKTIQVKNLGTLNNALSGDVMVGFFRPYNAVSSGANNHYFMIYNGLTDYTGDKNATAQKITVSFDFTGTTYNSLLRANRDCGILELVQLESLGGSKYQLELTLEGGTADLFKINDGQPFVGF